MFKYFKRNNTTIENQLSKMVKNPKINFQLDIYRNNDIDFQIIRQRLLKNIHVDTEVIEPNGFAIIISFNKNTLLGNSRFEKFVRSSLNKYFIKTKKIDLNITFYFMLCDNDYKKITGLIYRIQNEIYDYTNETQTVFEFKKIR